MTFPPEIELSAFKASNGEFAWKREHIPVVIEILVRQSFAVLGGEFCWVPPESRKWTGLIPQKIGPDAVYTWETNRNHGESWGEFVQRCARDSQNAVEKWADDSSIPGEIASQIFCNLTWISESSFDQLKSQ